MSALRDPTEDATEAVAGRSLTSTPTGGSMSFAATPYGFEVWSDPLSRHAPIPTGGLYKLVYGNETSIERIGSIDSSTWAAIESEYLLRSVTRAPFERFAAGVRQLTTGQLLASLMVGAGLRVPTSTPVEHTVIGDPFATIGHPHAEDPATGDREAAPEDPEAYRAFKQLGAWLSVDDEQVSDMLGIGRTTPYAWKREAREPRPENARRVYEYHAVLDSLRRRLGLSGFQLWLRSGHPTRRERLLAGELEALDRDVHSVLFQQTTEDRPDLGWAPEPKDAGVSVEAAGVAPRRASRRPRRARLT
jgi:hypothetical protein